MRVRVLVLWQRAMRLPSSATADGPMLAAVLARLYAANAVPATVAEYAKSQVRRFITKPV